MSTNLKFEFMKNFIEISNTISIYSRCIRYDCFLSEDRNGEDINEWQEDIDFLKKMVEYYDPKTPKRTLLDLGKNLIASFDNCIILNYNKYRHINDIFKGEINKLKKIALTSRKIIIVSRKMNNRIEKDEDIKNEIFNNKEIYPIYQNIQDILKIHDVLNQYKNMNPKLKSSIANLKPYLEGFRDFLGSELKLLLTNVNKERANYQVMLKYTINNLFESETINPFFMYLVYQNLDERTHFRISEKQEISLYWIHFRESLKLFSEIIIQIKMKNKSDMEFIYSDKINFQLLSTILNLVKSGKSPTASIKSLDLKPSSESRIRQWIKVNSTFYAKFKGRTYSEILKIATDEDIAEWFKILGNLDVRFMEQI